MINKEYIEGIISKKEYEEVLWEYDTNLIQIIKEKENNKSVILTSAVKGVDSATTLALKEFFEGEFKSGATTYTYDDGGVGIPDENPNLDQAVIDEATNAFKKSNIEKDYAKVNSNKELTINGEI